MLFCVTKKKLIQVEVETYDKHTQIAGNILEYHVHLKEEIIR